MGPHPRLARRLDGVQPHQLAISLPKGQRHQHILAVGPHGIEILAGGSAANAAECRPSWRSRTAAGARYSHYGEWEADPFGAKIVAAVAAAGEAGELTKLPDNAMMRMFLNSMPINSLSTLLGEGGKKITKFMVDEYAKLAK